MTVQSRFTRFSGVIAILAGVLLMIAEIAYAFFGSENVADMTIADRISGYAFLSGALFLAFTAVALGVHHVEKGGWFAIGSFFVAFLGSALMVTSDWTEVFGLPFMVENGITEPGGSLIAGFIINFLTYAIGWVISGIVMLWVNRVSRLATLSMLLGIVLVFGLFGLDDLARTYRVLDFVVWFFWYGSYIWMGWSLLHRPEEITDLKHDVIPAAV